MAGEARSLRLTTREIAAGVLQALFYLAYPLVLYLAQTRLETRPIAALILALYVVTFAFRVRGSKTEFWSILRPHLPLGVLIAIALALGERTLLLLLPSLVSLYVFGTFAWTLRQGPSMIERFARMVEDDLPPFTFRYCRRVTIVWCGFLGLNAIGVAGLALFGPVAWWAAYTGLVFYLLLGLLLGTEFCFRKLWFRYYGDGPTDRLLARFFPAEQTANGRRSLAYVELRRARSLTR
ncbi:MAG: hypothetical protein V3T07_00215 [Myxococcota bacterium]